MNVCSRIVSSKMYDTENMYCSLYIDYLSGHTKYNKQEFIPKMPFRLQKEIKVSSNVWGFIIRSMKIITRKVVHGQLVEPAVCLSDLYDVFLLDIGRAA